MLKKILNLLVAMPVIVNLFSKVKLLFKEEVSYSLKNILILLVLMLLSLGIIFIIWICLLSILFLYLISLNISWILSITAIILINIILLSILIINIYRLSNRVKFPGMISIVQGLIQ
jgi:hypothetical protein